MQPTEFARASLVAPADGEIDRGAATPWSFNGGSASASARPTGGGLRLRALLIALPLLLGICFISLYTDMVTQTVQLGALQIAPPAVAALFVLVLANRGLKRLFKRELLSHADLLHIYAMLLVGVMISTRGVVEKLIAPLAYLPYYATRENKLGQTMMQHMPAWAVPYAPHAPLQPIPAAIRAYYEGGSAIPWGVWWLPLLAWFALIACVLWVFACMSTLLRRQWMDHEQLRFPLTTLPLAMISNELEGQPFWTNPMMWIGIAISVGVFGLNGLHANNPSWPAFVLDFYPGALFTERPWNQMQGIELYISLAALGFAFFLPTDLLFSFWFFFLMTRAQDVMTVQLGGVPTSLVSHDTHVFAGYQTIGAYLVLVGAQARLGWPYFRQVWRTAWARDPARRPLDDSGEMMSYRAALCGVIGGVVCIVFWLTLAGMNPVVAFAQMGIYMFVVALMMSRGVCEAGMIIADTSFLPMHVMALIAPVRDLGASNLNMIAMTNAVFARDLRGVMLSPFIDNQRMARDLKVRQRVLMAPLVLAIVVSFWAACYFFLHLSYSRGALSLMSYPNFNAANMYGISVRALHGNAVVADSTCYGGFAVGIVVTIALVWMRSNFLWFPLHPLAYALCPAGLMNVLWFSFFLAWLMKSLVMRFGGIDLFRRLTPLMLGLILGEFLAAVFWALLAIPYFGYAAPHFPWV